MLSTESIPKKSEMDYRKTAQYKVWKYFGIASFLLTVWLLIEIQKFQSGGSFYFGSCGSWWILKICLPHVLFFVIPVVIPFYGLTIASLSTIYGKKKPLVPRIILILHWLIIAVPVVPFAFAALRRSR